ncbi:MAG: LytR/AlgR family response regulator transcription factor [Cyclonatronaceae bacterium]
MNCIIVDDEQISRDILAKLIHKTSNLNLMGSCESAVEALELMRQKSVDLIFLDVEMPELSGIEFLSAINQKPLIIFVTSKEMYAVEAFEHDAVDYLLKPLNYPRFARAVSKARDIFESRQTVQNGMTNLFVKKDNQLVKIRFSEILFIEAAADYMIIFTQSGRFMVNITMKALNERLPERDFIRVHRTYTVRRDKIDSMEDNAVSVGGRKIPIGGSYKNKLYKSLNLL